MKTTHEIKRFFKEKFGLKVVGNTSSGRARWQGFRIRPEPSKSHLDPLVYKSQFPADFRQLCIRTVYPTSPTLQQQTSAGNIMGHSIAMLPHEWETVIEQTLRAGVVAKVEAAAVAVAVA